MTICPHCRSGEYTVLPTLTGTISFAPTRVEYRLLSGDKNSNFVALVNDHLSQGWSLHGSTFTDARDWIFQPVIREVPIA